MASKAGYFQDGTAAVPTGTSLEEDKLLKSGRRKSVPGKGFKAKFSGSCRDYSIHCNDLLQQAYTAGCPSMRLNVKGHMYKFDFETMEQRNLNTLETAEMRAPHDLERPVKNPLFRMENLLHPFTKGRQSFKENVTPQRPVYVVRVPAGGPGKTILVPHCKKLGKSLRVAVPAEAKVGQPLFLPVPCTAVKTKLKYAAGGAAGGGGAVLAGVAAGEATATAVCGAGGAAALGAAAPVIAGGVVVAGVAVAAAAGVHYASKNPTKAMVIGALTVAGLAAIDHVRDVGVFEAAGDAAELAGDAVEATGDVAEGARAVAEDVGDELADAADELDWSRDAAEDGVDFILDLF